MAHHTSLEDKLIVLIGGGGFLGAHLAQELLRRGARVRIAQRRPEQAYRLRPLANLGQIQFMRCTVKDRRSLAAAMQGADAAVYLVGTFGRDQYALQAEGAGFAAEAAAAAGAGAFAYVSAIGADADSDSGYASTKGLGEQAVLAAFPKATIVRPAVLFGEDDRFLMLFAGLIARFPVVPVVGPEARLRPLFVDDAAEAIATALADPANHGGKTYEIAGPEELTMAELHRRIARAQHRERAFPAVPDALSAAFAALPGTPMNSDQWKLLQRGSVTAGKLPGLAELGVAPRPLGLFLDRWMTRFRKHGRFGDAGVAA
ncbi:MAG TPA: NAD-dependent epimerase/dehydratase family protein [Croceibacterium sp.]|nr:NAD-dependent epimerase/dehydratase family protein [Croceibacterium sp.]